MGDTAKRLKLDDDDVRDDAKLLIDICNFCRDRIAIEYHDLTSSFVINYAEVNIARNSVANILRFIENFEFVGINFDILEYCVPSLMLGILTSGNGFVNLPTHSCISDQPFDHLCIKYLFVRCLQFDAEVICQFQIHDQLIYLVKSKGLVQNNIGRMVKNTYAYGVATSGSTGLPKTVKVPHSCIIPNITDLHKILSITDTDKIAQLTNFTFDPSIIEIFLSLSCGATLFMVSKDLKNDAYRLLEKVFENHVTILQMTPSVFFHSWSSEHLRTMILGQESCLRVLVLGGEHIPKLQLLSEVKHSENKTRIFEIYGITEVSCWASINEIEFIDTSVNTSCIGVPLSETQFEVRDEKGNVLTQGEGSLHIGSSIRICAINAENIDHLKKPVFRNSGDIVAIDEQGRISYKGRQNSIIKRYGNKVNLHEINKTVLKLKFVRNCYTLWDEAYHKLHLFILSIKVLPEIPSMKSDLIEFLKKLPAISRPDKIHFLENFEFTTSGKICTNFLKQICIQRNNTERDIVVQNIQELFEDIWSQYLTLKNDGFLKLGGTSVTALQISGATSEVLKMEFPELIGLLLKDATIENCVAYIKSKISNDKNSCNDATDLLPVSKQLISNTSETVQKEITCSNSNIPLNQENICQWQKCRGNINGSISRTHRLQLDKTITNIQILNSYNLQKCVDASPTVFYYTNGKTFATVGSHSGIICTVELNPETNAIPYEIKLPDRIEASVLIMDNFRGIVGCYDGGIYCVNLKTGEIIWKFQTGSSIKCTAITNDQRETIFVGSYDHCIYCLSAKDGSPIWKIKASNGSISATGCLHPQTNSVLFGALDGSCLALRQSTGKLLWKQKLVDPIFVAPVVLDTGHVLFCSVAGVLSCFDVQADTKIWTYTVNGNIFSYPIRRNDPITNRETIIIASQNKSLYCLELKNSAAEPTLKYILNLPSPVFATTWCEKDIIYVVCTDGTSNVYSFSEGRLLTTIKLSGEVFSSPVIHDDLIVAGCRDNRFYILRLE